MMYKIIWGQAGISAPMTKEELDATLLSASRSNIGGGVDGVITLDDNGNEISNTYSLQDEKTALANYKPLDIKPTMVISGSIMPEAPIIPSPVPNGGNIMNNDELGLFVTDNRLAEISASINQNPLFNIPVLGGVLRGIGNEFDLLGSTVSGALAGGAIGAQQSIIKNTLGGGQSMDLLTMMMLMGGGGNKNMLMMLMLMGYFNQGNSNSGAIDVKNTSTMLPILLASGGNQKTMFPILGALNVIPPTLAAIGSMMSARSYSRPRTRVVYRKSYSRRRY